MRYHSVTKLHHIMCSWCNFYALYGHVSSPAHVYRVGQNLSKTTQLWTFLPRHDILRTDFATAEPIAKRKVALEKEMTALSANIISHLIYIEIKKWCTKRCAQRLEISIFCYFVKHRTNIGTNDVWCSTQCALARTYSSWR